MAHVIDVIDDIMVSARDVTGRRGSLARASVIARLPRSLSGVIQSVSSLVSSVRSRPSRHRHRNTYCDEHTPLPEFTVTLEHRPVRPPTLWTEKNVSIYYHSRSGVVMRSAASVCLYVSLLCYNFLKLYLK